MNRNGIVKEEYVEKSEENEEVKEKREDDMEEEAEEEAVENEEDEDMKEGETEGEEIIQEVENEEKVKREEIDKGENEEIDKGENEETGGNNEVAKEENGEESEEGEEVGKEMEKESEETLSEGMVKEIECNQLEEEKIEEERNEECKLMDTMDKEQYDFFDLQQEDDYLSNSASLFTDSLVPQASMRTGYSGSIFGEDELNYGEVDSMPEVVDDETEGYEDNSSLQEESTSIRQDRYIDSNDETELKVDKPIYEEQFSENAEESELPLPRVESEFPTVQGLPEEPIVSEEILDSHEGSPYISPPLIEELPSQPPLQTLHSDSSFASGDEIHSQSESSTLLDSSDVELKEYVERSPSKPYRPHRSRSPHRNRESLYLHSRKAESEELNPKTEEIPLIPASVLRRGMVKPGIRMEKLTRSVDDRVLIQSTNCLDEDTSLKKYMSISDVVSTPTKSSFASRAQQPTLEQTSADLPPDEITPREATSQGVEEKDKQQNLDSSTDEVVVSTKDLFGDLSLEQSEGLPNTDNIPAVTRIQPRSFANSLRLNVIDEIATPVLHFPSKSTKSSPITEESHVKKAVTKPSPKPVVKPVPKPDTKPVTKPDTKPTKPDTNPVTKPDTKFITKPASKPTVKPVSKPVVKPPTEPIQKSDTKPISKPTTKSTVKPLTKTTTTIKQSKSVVSETPVKSIAMKITTNKTSSLQTPPQQNKKQSVNPTLPLSQPLSNSEEKVNGHLDSSSEQMIEKINHHLATYNNQIRSAKAILSVSEGILYYI